MSSANEVINAPDTAPPVTSPPDAEPVTASPAYPAPPVIAPPVIAPPVIASPVIAPPVIAPPDIDSPDADDGNADIAPHVIAPPVIASPVAEVEAAEVAGDVSASSAPDQITVALVDEIVEDNDRKKVELGLQRFNATNATNNVCGTIVDAIQARIQSSESIKLYCNPAIGLLSDFAPHYKMLISVNGDDSQIEGIITSTFAELITRPMFDGLDARITPAASFMGDHFNQISLVLWIGTVFHVPVFTAYIAHNAFNHAGLDAALDTDLEPFQHNAKMITNCNQADVFLELLLHSEESDIYAPVNVLIARGIRASIVSKFTEPNAAIAAGCQPFFDMIQPPGLKSVVAKMALIAVMQDPSVKTAQGEHFSDIFPSGQYGKYFGEVAHRATTDTTNQGPINTAEGVPLTRTDIIIAAMTAMNTAMKEKDAHMVISGGAAVSFYIQEFLNNLDSFNGVAASQGMDMAHLKKECRNIKMNDIDCIVFGDVSRQFLSVFSLYMMILYDNFYARPKRYGVIEKDAPPISFVLSASDKIDLYMYGNRDDDSNTMLVSKRLRKEPSVQLVTQKTKCFSQIMHPLCEQHRQSQGCKEDDYYLEPIDLVKKTIEHFVKLYMRSLYPKEESATQPERIQTMLKDGYSGNLVSLKIIMLDIICIFCDEGASLFCRIFMARKNPKDFARLRVFIDIYLLQLLRSGGDSFAQENAEFIANVGRLRDLMARLNADYYLEQGSIAAFDAATAEQLNARRDEFLGLLREVGRAIVDLAAPEEPVPTQFREITGATTIQLFRESSPQIKYPFDMSQHMDQLFEAYTRGKAGESYDAWLNSVFETILVAPKVESVFREKLSTILSNSMNPESNYEISFKDMPTMSPHMLQLLNALKGVHYNTAFVHRYRLILRDLLKPLKYAQKTSTPTAIYVGVRTKPDGLYDTHQKALFPFFVTALLLGNKKMKDIDVHTTALIELIEHLDHGFDDAVSEEIGRILLEYAVNVNDSRLSGGGSTRKCKRVCRLKNARTRAKPRTGKRRNTRRKIKANKLRFNRTHR